MKTLSASLSALFVFMIFFSIPALAQSTIYVDQENSSGPWDGSSANPFQLIQDGIDTALSGDTVLVMPGSYAENIDFTGKGIAVISDQGPSVTTIDGGNSASVVTFENGEGPDSILNGFTLTSGLGSSSPDDSGGGITCGNSSSPTISHNIITGNTSQHGGGILIYDNSNPTIVNNAIYGNSSTAYGGGVYSLFSSPIITNNTIFSNSAESGGGFYCYQDIPVITNTIFWNNSATAGAEIYVHAGNPLITYSDIQAATGEWWFGEGCIDSDPFLTDLLNGEFHLLDSSPCIDSGNNLAPNIPETDFDNEPRIMRETVDIGADELLKTLLVPSEYASIQDAIDAAMEWDVVLVEPDSVNGGPYVENIHILGKLITVKSSSGPEKTTIDGNSAGTVVSITGVVDGNTKLEGFTITNGADSHGGGIYCSNNANPTIFGNIIKDNNAGSVGGGIYCGGNVKIVSNVLSGNTATDGGGVYCYFLNESPKITNNTIYGNSASSKGGGVCSYTGNTKMANNILWKNSALAGTQIYDYNGSSIVGFCDVEGGFTGTDNINLEPLFVDAQNGDFHLRLESPCIDVGMNNAFAIPDMDYEGDERIVDGNSDTNIRVDIGADELRLEMAVRFGNVNSEGTTLANVLFVNDSAGDNRRKCREVHGTNIIMRMDLPYSGPNPAQFAVYAWAGEPGIQDLAEQPYSVGTSCFPLPSSAGAPAPPPITLANNIGYRWLLGVPYFPDALPAPSIFLSYPYLQVGTYAFQGLIYDNASSSPEVPISITNAIVLEIYE